MAVLYNMHIVHADITMTINVLHIEHANQVKYDHFLISAAFTDAANDTYH